MKLEASTRLLRTTLTAWSYRSSDDPWYKAQQVLEDWISAGSIKPTVKQQAAALDAFELARKKVGAQHNMPAVVYRGLVVKKSMLNTILTEGITPKPRYLSSWTADPMVARDYAWSYSASNEIGIILATNTKGALLYLDAVTVISVLGVQQAKGAPLQKEVVMRGNGVKRIDRKTLLAIVPNNGQPQKVSDYIEQARKELS